MAISSLVSLAEKLSRLRLLKKISHRLVGQDLDHAIVALELDLVKEYAQFDRLGFVDGQALWAESLEKANRLNGQRRLLLLAKVLKEQIDLRVLAQQAL